MKLSARRIAAWVAAGVTALAPLSGATAQTGEPAAWHGQHLGDQPVDIQNMFHTVWADQAAKEWSSERSLALPAAWRAC